MTAKQSTNGFRVATLPLLALIALAIASCGGDDGGGSSEGPADVAKSFSVAAAEGDGEAACALLTDSGKQSVEDDLGTSCEEAVSAIYDTAAESGEDVLGAVENATYEVVEETDDTASVQATAEGDAPDTPFELVKVDGEWLIDG